MYTALLLAAAHLMLRSTDMPSPAEARLDVRPSAIRAVAPPTPRGLPACHKSLASAADLPRIAGETVRYLVDVDGLSVGTIDFQITRNGAYQGRAVTEYRSLFKLDALVATLIPVDGRAAAIVALGASTPIVAMNHYTSGAHQFQEDVTYAEGASRLESAQKKDASSKTVTRRFLAPAYDFVSAFYMLRSLPADAAGCTVVYGNQRAYTIWLVPDGSEDVPTPIGLQPSDRYQVRYASERAKAPTQATLWLARDAQRLPYRARIEGSHALEARIHLYEKGKP
ncbi:MAG: DUF3108 domain-containing protein [Myxococcota bacterium]